MHRPCKDIDEIDVEEHLHFVQSVDAPTKRHLPMTDFKTWLGARVATTARESLLRLETFWR